MLVIGSEQLQPNGYNNDHTFYLASNFELCPLPYHDPDELDWLDDDEIKTMVIEGPERFDFSYKTLIGRDESDRLSRLYLIEESDDQAIELVSRQLEEADL